jgi:hypothetical protein
MRSLSFRFWSVLIVIGILGVLTYMALSLPRFRNGPTAIEIVDAVTDRETTHTFRNGPVIIEGVDRMTDRERMEGETDRSNMRLPTDQQPPDRLPSEPVSPLP